MSGSVGDTRDRLDARDDRALDHLLSAGAEAFLFTAAVGLVINYIHVPDETARSTKQS